MRCGLYWFLFAWFQASAAVSAPQTSNIGVIKTAQLEALTLTASYAGTGATNTIKSVDLTTVAGVGMVWDTVSDSAKEATNQSSLVKSEKITVSISGSSMNSAYIGSVYEVKLKATNNIRIGTTFSPSGTWNSNCYVGSYNNATAYNSTTHAFTGGDQVSVGKIKIHDANTIKYWNGTAWANDSTLIVYASVTGNNSDEGAYDADTAASIYDGVIGVDAFTLVADPAGV